MISICRQEERYGSDWVDRGPEQQVLSVLSAGEQERGQVDDMVWWAYLELEADIVGQGTVNKKRYCLRFQCGLGWEIQQ